MRRLLAAVLLGFLSFAPAHAQTGSSKTPAILNANVNSLFPDQTAGGITPFDMRQMLLDIIASYGTISTTTNTWTGRQILTYSPVFDLSSNSFSTAMLFPLSSNNITIPANKTFSVIRIGQADGSDNTFTVGANSQVSGFYSILNSNSGSDTSSSVYSGVLHASNDGPGTVRGLHAEAVANAGSGSTGVTTAIAGQVQPIATTNAGSASFLASLTSTGVNNVASAYTLSSANGDQFRYGVGTAVSAVPIGIAFYQAWMATGSATNARAFQILNNSGSEIAHWNKDGTINTSTIGETATVITVNQNAAAAPAAPTNGVDIAGVDSAGTGFSVDTFGANGVHIFRRADGTGASPSKVLNTELIGLIGWRGYNNSGGSGAYSAGNTARISALAAEDWNDNTHVGTNLTFTTTPTASGSAAQAFEIFASGGVGVGAAPTDPGIGNIVASLYKVGTTQVVGARITGYTAMTGTPDKATAYATSTVTTAQLAGRVAQLQADLTTHGLIGP